MILQSEHYEEMDQETKQEFGPKPETNSDEQNYFHFWEENFPYLLIHTWRILEEQPRVCVTENFEIATKDHRDYFS